MHPMITYISDGKNDLKTAPSSQSKSKRHPLLVDLLYVDAQVINM